MVVLTAAQVAAVLHKDLAAHDPRERDTKKKLLVRLDLNHSTVTWGSGAACPPAIRWLDFWSELDQCGEPGWPQLIRLPARITPAHAQALYPPPQVAEMLQQAASMLTAGQWDDAEPLVTLEPDEDGNYQIMPAPVDALGESQDHTTNDDEADAAADNRQIVFLDARALFLPAR